MCGFFAGRRTLRLVKTWKCPKSIARTQPSLPKAHLDVQLYVWILPKENDTHTYHSRCAFPTLSLDFSPGKAHHFNKGIDLHHFGLIWKRSFSWCNEIFFIMIERPKPPQNASFCFPLLMCFCGWMVTNARHSNDVLYLYTRVWVGGYGVLPPLRTPIDFFSFWQGKQSWSWNARKIMILLIS